MSRRVGGAIGLDVHRDFCEVAICEAGRVRSAGRVKTTPEALKVLAHSLLASDRVALEVTGGAWEIARILEGHVRRVVIVSPDDTGIRQARAKTDRLDARTLARLLWAGELDGVWMPDERSRVLRRRLGRREQLVRSRSHSKNEIHAVLMRRLKGKPPVSDLFGVKGTQVAARAKAAGRGGRDGPVRDAPRRVPRPRDRRGRAADRPRGAALGRRPAVADRARGQRDLRGVVSPRSATSAGLAARGSWSPISGLTRGFASRAASRPAAAGSPSGGRRPRAGRWSRRHAALSVSPGRCAPSTSGSAPAAATARPSLPRRASSRSCSGACSRAARTTPTGSRR